MLILMSHTLNCGIKAQLGRAALVEGLALKPQGEGVPGHTEDKQDAPKSPATSLQRLESQG